jgi:hypothetical protein
MKGVLNEVGPIAVSIDASLKTFQLYSEGVYDDPNCSSTAVNHAMLLVGYTPGIFMIFSFIFNVFIYFLMFC